MAYEPLHHKYRPQSLAQLVGQEAIAQTLTNAINSRRIAPAYLFTGPRGTGKTSSARILAKSLNCLTSEVPTAEPCGKCDVCLGITQGRTLDVIEIDAASNTGVDNIRDLIEKAQFAPAQCRYKVYVIDECLTGDSLVETDVGFMRIDDPQIEGQKVLSYNETTTEWEYKNVVRWLDQGEREIFVIKTNNSQIRCTGNHLLRTENGWIEAKNLQLGMRILSPENLQTVVSVQASGLANVYDIEVADNHNFVANGLLVHNCHMLSVAAF
ncbi:MAG: polymorphic toxin-type HINT domain-containing protein, partial [Microcoleaceae cyanobacterium]